MREKIDDIVRKLRELSQLLTNEDLDILISYIEEDIREAYEIYHYYYEEPKKPKPEVIEE